MSAGKLMEFQTTKADPAGNAEHDVIRSVEIDVADFVGGQEAFAAAQASVAFVGHCAGFLKKMREKAGLSPRDMADALGISVSRISQLESGAMRHAPSLRTAALYAAACGERLTLSSAPSDFSLDLDQMLDESAGRSRGFNEPA